MNLLLWIVPGAHMTERIAEHQVLPVIISRWSRRAMSGEPVSEQELMSLFEAARWAPSSYNGQPWRYIYARKGCQAWDLMFDLLNDVNKLWCVNAGVLMILASRTHFESNGKLDRSFALNAGASWQNLALQGCALGLAVRGMQDFDYDRAGRQFSIHPLFAVQMMIAVGRPGNSTNLPETFARERCSDAAQAGLRHRL
jgi:nitroreductase